MSSHRRGAQGHRSTDTTLCCLWGALGGDCRSCLHRGSTCCAHDTELAQCSPGVSPGSRFCVQVLGAATVPRGLCRCPSFPLSLFCLIAPLRGIISSPFDSALRLCSRSLPPPRLTRLLLHAPFQSLGLSTTQRVPSARRDRNIQSGQNTACASPPLYRGARGT